MNFFSSSSSSSSFSPSLEKILSQPDDALELTLTKSSIFSSFSSPISLYLKIFNIDFILIVLAFLFFFSPNETIIFFPNSIIFFGSSYGYNFVEPKYSNFVSDSLNFM